MSAGRTQSSIQTPSGESAAWIAPPAADLTCPRCGYDQSGLEQSLRSQCERSELEAWPLRSTCAECGREFQWGNFYNLKPRESEFFETATTRRFRAFWTTVWRMPRAGRFWRGVNAEWPLRPWRMVSVLLVAAFLWFSFASTCLVGSSMLMERTRLATEQARRDAYVVKPNTSINPLGLPPPTSLSNALGLVLPVAVFEMPMGDRILSFRAWVLVALSATCLLPIVCGTFAATLRPGRVRWATLFRAWCYGLPRLLIAMAVGSAILRVVLQASLLVAALAQGSTRDQLFGWAISLRSVIVTIETAFPVVVILLVMWHWWTCAFRNHTKLQRPGSVAAAAIVVSFMVCWIVALIIPATRASVTLFD
jgi:hypothetical protein